MANQCTAIAHDEEDESFSHHLRHNLQNLNGDNDNFIWRTALNCQAMTMLDLRCQRLVVEYPK